MSKHTLSVLVENKPGVLARIAGLFSRRGFNIDSLAVGPTEHPEVSRMTVVVDVDELPLEQVTKQLNKLVNVIKIVELDRAAVGAARAPAGQGPCRPRPPARTSWRPCSCSAPRSSTSRRTPSSSRRPATRDKLEALLKVLEPFGIRSSCSPAWSRSVAAPARSPTGPCAPPDRAAPDRRPAALAPSVP